MPSCSRCNTVALPRLQFVSSSSGSNPRNGIPKTEGSHTEAASGISRDLVALHTGWVRVCTGIDEVFRGLAVSPFQNPPPGVFSS